MCSFAEIKLTLSNVGRDSYQPQVYGRRVVVVRKIQKDGSSYMIMNTDGMHMCIVGLKMTFDNQILSSHNLTCPGILTQTCLQYFLCSQNNSFITHVKMKL